MARFFGAIGGAIFGVVFALALKVLIGFPSSALYFFLGVFLCSGLTSVVGFCLPERFEPFVFFVNIFIDGELDFDNCPIRVAIAAISFFFGMLVMLVALLIQVNLLGFIGAAMVVPFSYYSIWRNGTLSDLSG